MDVSIAVSLIRGQMGTVVERAVNGAVETVLSEMLKVVGVKFEELKAQVAVMKRDMAVLQREKALKEKENENIQAKLRYTELKLKYYRQGVEEELQQRLSASATVRLDPSTFHQAPRGGTLSQTANSDGTQSRRGQEGARVLSGGGGDAEWTGAPLTHTDAGDAVSAPPAVLPLAVDGGQQPPGSLASPQNPSAPEVKQEAEEVICIKEEPEEEEVMATLLLDCKLEQGHHPETEAHGSDAEQPALSASQSNPVFTFSSTGANTYVMLQPTSTLLSTVPLSPSVAPRPVTQAWSKDLRLYEGYKMRRNELRLRSLNRRWEHEKALSQIADIERERREKTRLRVARWRAKRKLQACLDAQAASAAAGFPQRDSTLSAPLQPPSVSVQSSAAPACNTPSPHHLCMPSTSSCSSSSSSSALPRPSTHPNCSMTS